MFGCVFFFFISCAPSCSSCVVVLLFDDSVYVYIWSHTRNRLHFVQLVRCVFNLQLTPFSIFPFENVHACIFCALLFFILLRVFVCVWVLRWIKLDIASWLANTFNGSFCLASPYSHMNVKSNIFYKASTHLHAHPFGSFYSRLILLSSCKIVWYLLGKQQRKWKKMEENETNARRDSI